MDGLLITVEGIEGAGKTTIIKQIKDWWIQRGTTPITCREPGGTKAGEAIRKLLLETTTPMSPETELFLIQAARTQMMHEIVEPLLAKSKVVLLDRHTDSTTAYQGYGRGLDIEQIETINNFAAHGRRPDLTILLDLDVKTGLQRAQRRNNNEPLIDRFESETFEFIERIRQGFLELAKKNPQRFLVVSSEENVDRVWKKIEQELTRRFPGKAGE